jgi:photosystem II stability/assembly factor-like uncharacterized protein
MKNHLKIPLLIFAFCLFTFAFIGDSPPGWYQQTLPVNDIINDIFFLDSSTGWVVTDGRTNTNDTGYIMKTTDGGNSWQVQYNQPMKLTGVQFLDANTGYVIGGSGTGTGRAFKTTNAGINWNQLANVSGLGDLDDLCFVNKDTGWICDAQGFGGLIKTTNGGANWQLQLNDTYFPKKIFMLNNDTGWAICQNVNIYKTTNSGVNWNMIANFGSNGVNSIFFINKNTGWITGGSGATGIMKSTNGGNNWFAANNPTPFGPSQLFFVDSTHGWAGSGLSKIVTTKDGVNWDYQTTPNFSHYNVFFTDTSNGWAAGGGTDIIHTTDGGGPVGINQLSSEIPTDYTLYQNYPNPFNPVTSIKYNVKSAENIKVVIYDIQGKILTVLADEKHSAGTYEVKWHSSNYSSGVYFYSLLIEGRVADTKKMILMK